MPQFDIAAVSLLQLLGFLEAEGGAVNWMWLGDPATRSLQSIPARREYFGRLLRALQNGGVPTDPFADFDSAAAADLAWEPLSVGPLDFGFAWTKAPNNEVRLALAARAKTGVGNPPLTLAVVARLARITSANGGDLASELGEVGFAGTLPVPDFLKSASIAGHLPPLDLTLTVQDQSDPGGTDDSDTRALALNSSHLGWDVGRLATFLLRAFVAPHAADADGFFSRVQNHLFPLLGTPGGVIAPFPAVQPMQTDPDGAIDDWKDSVLGTPSGALTLLWHLRALITGNESPDFIEASYHVPLHVPPGTPSAGPPLPGTATSTVAPSALDEVGAWLGITSGQRIVLEVRLTPGQANLVEIPLAVVAGDTLTRPTIPVGALTKLVTPFTIPIPGSATPLKGKKVGNTWRITLLELNAAGTGTPLDGKYGVDVLVTEGQEVTFAIDAPLVGAVDFPAQLDPAAIVGKLLQMVVGAVPAGGHPMLPVAKALTNYLSAALAHPAQPPAASDVLPLATALLGGTTITLGEAVDIGLTPAGELSVAAKLGPIDLVQQSDLAVRIGTVHATARLPLTNPQSPRSFSIGIIDFRVALPSGGGGLLGSLLPDLTKAPGFSLTVGWTQGQGISIGGGGRIPVEQTFGPLSINTLAIDVSNTRTRVGIDLSFQLSAVTVAAHELGVEFNHTSGAVTPYLHGLALSCNTGGIVLAGMFGAVTQNGQTDYVGGAVVSVMNLFELSAIGGYAQGADGKPSMFVFASLVAPLGGPPWMFITGIAGGFGYNRALPPTGLLAAHPFLKVMRGEIALGNDAQSALTAVSGMFASTPGQHWIAAGIQFTSFGLINGKLVVVVGLGHHFSLSVLGLAAFGIKPVAYFEIALEASANEQQFLMLAGVSPNSYIIHPDLFSLRGQFALLTRHANPGAGDFVFSIGGYHPSFPRPSYYPVVERVGAKSVLYGFVRLSVEAFFACTPQAMMAGASMSLSAKFAGIAAGLDVYVDVFITWDPFFLQARMGVCVWFEFFGRHEISVTLEIHTPPFGGTAEIDLAITTFEIAFGTPLAAPPQPSLPELMTRMLGVPAEPSTKNTVKRARHHRFNDGEGAGLFRVDVTWGRPSDAQAWKSETQEGLVDRIRVNAEFGFTVRTRLPIDPVSWSSTSSPAMVATNGYVDLPLSRIDNADSSLIVTGAKVNQALRGRVYDFFPAALFSEVSLPDAQLGGASAQAAVTAVDTTQAVVARAEGLRFEYTATLSHDPNTVTPLASGTVEFSQADERYPLPFGLQAGSLPMIGGPQTRVLFSAAQPPIGLRPSAGRVARTTLAAQAAAAYTNGVLHVHAMRADMQRFPAAVRTKGFTVAAPPPGSATITPPASPARRAELFGVHLRMVAPHAPVSLRRGRLDGVTRARNAQRLRLTPDAGVRGDYRTTLTVAAGRAEQLVLDGGRTSGTRVGLSGPQWTRVVTQSASGTVLADQYVPAGTRALALPRRARRLTLTGEGADAPVGLPDARGVQLADESIGIERDGVLMALGRNAFAAHGCTFEALAPLGLTVRPLDHVPGFAVLRAASRARMRFPAVPAGWTLVLTVVPAAAAAGSALEEVRWLAEDAALSGLMTLVAPDRTALMMTVAAPAPWVLELDLGTRWKLSGVVVAGESTRALYDAWRTSGDWDLVDDRLQAGPRTVTNVSVEIGYERPASSAV